MKTSDQKLSAAKRKVIKDISDFFKNNSEIINEQYFNVIDKTKLPRKFSAISDIYEEIDAMQFNKELLDVSIVIITANKFENDILNHYAYKENNETKILKLKNGLDLFANIDFRLVKSFILSIGQYKILHMHAPETGSNTPCGSADLVRYVNSNPNLQPSCIISFGVCYGIDCNKQKIGDTIVAKKIYPWSIGLKIDDRDWKIKHDDFIINLREHDKRLYDKIEEIIAGDINQRKDISFSDTETGNILTGEAVLNNEKKKIEAINRAYGVNITGGEMEGYGLAKECIYYLNTSCLIIKSICDWGACKDIKSYLGDDFPSDVKDDLKDRLQAYAAYCAYTFLKKILYEEIIEYSSTTNIIKEYLFDNYYKDGVLQEKRLINIITSKVKKLRNIMLNQTNIDKMVKDIIYDLVASDFFETKKSEGIIVYTFK